MRYPVFGGLQNKIALSSWYILLFVMLELSNHIDGLFETAILPDWKDENVSREMAHSSPVFGAFNKRFGGNMRRESSTNIIKRFKN